MSFVVMKNKTGKKWFAGFLVSIIWLVSFVHPSPLDTYICVYGFVSMQPRTYRNRHAVRRKVQIYRIQEA